MHLPEKCQSEERPHRGSLLGIINADGRPTVVRVVYSDESGVGDGKEPITVVTGIVINMDKVWEEVQERLEDILQKTPNILLEEKRKTFVLKGRLLYSILRKRRTLPELATGAETLLHRVLAIPVDCCISIFYGAIDRKKYERSEKKRGLSEREKKAIGQDATTYDLAFDQCLRKVENIARSFTNEKILWIAEQSDKQREPSTRMLHRVHGLRVESDGESPNLNRPHQSPIADTIYFGDPIASVALQLADVICSTVTLYLLEKHYRWRPVATPFYKFIEGNVIEATPPMLL